MEYLVIVTSDDMGITKGTVSGRLTVLLSTSLLLATTIFVFCPFTIYSGNPVEIGVSITTILRLFLLPALMLICLTTAMGVLLPEKLYLRYVSLLLATGVLVWFQGNILVWQYGPLDGHIIDWSEGSWRGLLDGALWAGALTASFFFYRQISRNARFLSVTLVWLQLALLMYTCVQDPGIWNKKGRPKPPISPPAAIFEMSSKQNIVHIVLDALQSDMFLEVVNEGGDRYYKAFDGFTFFKNTVGTFPTTKFSIPAVFSGKLYKNDIPMNKFVEQAYSGDDTISNMLYDKGYRVDMVGVNEDPLGLNGGRFTNSYAIPTPYGATKRQFEMDYTLYMFNLVLFRSSPHYLKKYVELRWLFRFDGLFGSSKIYARTWYFSSKAFLDDMIRKIHVGTDKPLYKYIHLMTTHTPIVVNEKGEYAGSILPPTRHNVKVQYRCSVDQLLVLLDELKRLSVYDSSLIIVHGDHGFNLFDVKLANQAANGDGGLVNDKKLFPKIVGGAMPALLVKPPFAKGPMTVSSVPAALTDIPDTVCSVTGIRDRFGGRPLFDITVDEHRERKYNYYKFSHEVMRKDYFDKLYLFTVTGDVYDKRSWHQGAVLTGVGR